MTHSLKIKIGIAVFIAASLISITAQRSEKISAALGFLAGGVSPQPSLFADSAPAGASGSPAGGAVAAKPAVTPPKCPQSGTQAPTHAVLINEVAWAGTGRNASSQEWIELKNTGVSAAPLAHWQLLNKSESVAVFFDSRAAVPPRGFLLLERGSDAPIAGVRADMIFSGTLKNSDESLRLFDDECNPIDAVVTDAGKNNAWPAGTASPDYRTAERSADLSWHTYAGAGISGIFGTPKAENSFPSLQTASPPSSPLTPVVSPSPSIATSSPSAPNYARVPAAHVRISEVMAGMQDNKGYQFIELYNLTAAAVDLTGWTVKKKSAAGNESALVSASRLKGKSIAPGSYFLMAKEGGYSGPVAADVLWPAPYSLAYAGNVVTLYDRNGIAVDAVAWDTIPAGKSFARVAEGDDDFMISDPSPRDAASGF